MGGSGGGFLPPSSKSTDIKNELKNSMSETKNAEYDTKVSDFLNDQLIQYNDRDVAGIENKLDVIKTTLGKNIDGTLNSVFGGSVQKHTYVDGISDIDSLVILNNSELGDKNPEQVKDYFFKSLKDKLTGVKSIKMGDLAVTIEFKDGAVIQLLPAVKTAAGVKIQSAKANTWSEVNPQGFVNKLTKVNKKLEGKLVPTIKLIKGINSQFSEKRQITGYHIESLAIEVFKSYSGERTTKAMLEHFFKQAKSTVLSPIKDKTGQSVHVDQYLGSRNSENRKGVSFQLDLISRKLNSANNIASIDIWKNALGES
jgi:hypothetical protein